MKTDSRPEYYKSSKFKLVYKLINYLKEKKEKIVIVSQFPAKFSIIESFLKMTEIKFTVIQGGLNLTIKDRENILKDFSTKQDISVNKILII